MILLSQLLTVVIVTANFFKHCIYSHLRMDLKSAIAISKIISSLIAKLLFLAGYVEFA